MEVSVEQHNLSQELTLAMGSVEKRVTMPVLGNFLLEARDGLLTVSSTDLTLSYRSVVPAKTKTAGSICIPAVKFEPYIKALPAEAVTIKATEKDWVTVSCGRNRTRIAGQKAANFPVFDKDHTESFVVASDLLHQTLTRVAFAMGDDPVRFAINGAYLIFTDAGVTAVATNINTMAVAEAIADQSSTGSFILPTRGVKELLSLIDPKESFPVSISVSDKLASFGFKNRVFSTALIDGKYPNYARVIDRDLPHIALLPAGSMREVLNRVSRFAEERSRAVHLAFSENGLFILATTSDAGTAEESLEINYAGPEFQFKINANYVAEFLKVAGNNPIEIRFNNETTPTEWRIEGDQSYRYFVMPMV